MTRPPNDAAPRGGGAGANEAHVQPHDNPRLAAALNLAALGWRVFPVHTPLLGADGAPPRCSCGTPGCECIGKHPRTAHGFRDATTDSAVIRGWWTRWPNANVGVATGAVSGLVVLDVDPRHGGDVTLGELEARHGRLPETVVALTGGGGRHYLFAHPGGRIRNSAGNLGVGLDVRGDGGYIVVEPSLHASGRRYAWELSRRPGEVALAPTPPWLLDLIRAGEGKTEVKAGAPPVGDAIADGARNSTLFSLAGSMRRRGMSEAAMHAALRAENLAKCDPPLEDHEVAAITRSVMRYAPGDVPTGAATATVGPVRLVALREDDDGRVVVSALAEDGRELTRDRVNLDSALSRERFGKAVASAAQLTGEERAKLDAALRALKPPPAPPPPGESAHRSRAELLAELDERRQEALEQTPADIVREAEHLLADPRLVDRVVDDIATIGVVGERVLSATVYVQGLSRLLDEPISAIVQGTSSSGKSYIIARVARLFPDETVLIATDLTPNALYYLPPGRLIHCWVVAGERSRNEDPETADTKRALREMISAGELSKAVPIKPPHGGFETVVLRQPGPIAFVESTTSTLLFDEDANRCLLLSTDETPEQTARVIRAAAAAASSAGADAGRTIAVHHAAQRLLRRVRVRVPFASAIADAMPTRRPEARRAMRQILTMVRAVALLHQRQRAEGPLGDGDEIDAAPGDYVVARRLLEAPLGRSLGGALPDAVARFGERITARYASTTFTSTQALDEDGILTAKGKVNLYLRTLADAGVVECVEEHRGGKPNVWRVVGDVPKAGAAWLPTVAQLTVSGQ